MQSVNSVDNNSFLIKDSARNLMNEYGIVGHRQSVDQATSTHSSSLGSRTDITFDNLLISTKMNPNMHSAHFRHSYKIKLRR